MEPVGRKKQGKRGGKEAREVRTPGGRQTAEGYTAGEGPLAREGWWEELSSAVVKVVCKAMEGERRRNAVEDAARRGLIGDEESHGRFLCAELSAKPA